MKSFLYLLCFVLFAQYAYLQDLSVKEVFAQHNLVPDIFSNGPDDYLKVEFPSCAVTVETGVEVLPSDVHEQPTLSWDAFEEEWYTIFMIDIDTPTAQNRSESEFLHWLVVNVPGDDISQGDVKMEFLATGPPPGVGVHRYVFLVYQQSGIIEVEDERFSQSPPFRVFFSTEDFAKQYELSGPLAGNFYYAQNEENL